MKIHSTAQFRAEDYYPMVWHFASTIGSKLPPSVSFADLFSEGLLGLVEAHVRFNPANGAPFGAYARIRVRGAILNFVDREYRAAKVKDVLSLSQFAQPRPSLEAQTATRETVRRALKALHAQTDRQQMVMTGLLSGKSLRETAKDLGISRRTVAKLQNRSVEAMRAAL